MKRFAVIMAGGSGTRFWPRSSKKKPKQLLALTSSKTMLQATVDRLDGLVAKGDRWVVSTKLLEKEIKKQLGKVNVLAEPEGRNTMAAVCWSAWALFKRNPESVAAVLPADAFIADDEGYRLALKKAFETAEIQDRIVCLGIKPTFAATGYGYIESGASLAGDASEIVRFIEKPTTQKATELFHSGRYLWNAGIFVFKASTFISEVREHAPEYAKAFDELIKSPKKLSTIYKNLPKQPVDVALMEKTKRGAVVSGDFGWNDLGSWPALGEVLRSNSSAGVVNAKGGLLSLSSSDNIVDIATKKFVGLIGVKDMIIVETDEALLVCPKDKAQDIKELVALIEKDKKLKGRLL